MTLHGLMCAIYSAAHFFRPHFANCAFRRIFPVFLIMFHRRGASTLISFRVPYMAPQQANTVSSTRELPSKSIKVAASKKKQFAFHLHVQKLIVYCAWCVCNKVERPTNIAYLFITMQVHRKSIYFFFVKFNQKSRHRNRKKFDFDFRWFYLEEKKINSFPMQKLNLQKMKMIYFHMKRKQRRSCYRMQWFQSNSWQ